MLGSKDYRLFYPHARTAPRDHLLSIEGRTHRSADCLPPSFILLGAYWLWPLWHAFASHRVSTTCGLTTPFWCCSLFANRVSFTCLRIRTLFEVAQVTLLACACIGGKTQSPTTTATAGLAHTTAVARWCWRCCCKQGDTEQRDTENELTQRSFNQAHVDYVIVVPML